MVADGGHGPTTPTYYVFRHLSQYVVPGATVVGTTGGDAVAFKNPDGSLVAVMFNSGAANASYVVAIGGKKFQFAMPQQRLGDREVQAVTLRDSTDHHRIVRRGSADRLR